MTKKVTLLPCQKKKTVNSQTSSGRLIQKQKQDTTSEIQAPTATTFTIKQENTVLTVGTSSQEDVKFVQTVMNI